MLTADETRFYQFWTNNREANKRAIRPLLVGLSIGFTIGVAILSTIYLGWYTRATMQANSSMSPLLLFIAILIVAVFMAIFYRNYQWEMQEQRYLILKARMEAQEKKQTDAA